MAVEQIEMEKKDQVQVEGTLICSVSSSLARLEVLIEMKKRKAPVGSLPELLKNVELVREDGTDVFEQLLVLHPWCAVYKWVARCVAQRAKRGWQAVVYNSSKMS